MQSVAHKERFSHNQYKLWPCANKMNMYAEDNRVFDAEETDEELSNSLMSLKEKQNRLYNGYSGDYLHNHANDDSVDYEKKFSMLSLYQSNIASENDSSPNDPFAHEDVEEECNDRSSYENNIPQDNQSPLSENTLYHRSSRDQTGHAHITHDARAESQDRGGGEISEQKNFINSHYSIQASYLRSSDRSPSLDLTSALSSPLISLHSAQVKHGVRQQYEDSYPIDSYANKRPDYNDNDKNNMYNNKNSNNSNNNNYNSNNNKNITSNDNHNKNSNSSNNNSRNNNNSTNTSSNPSNNSKCSKSHSLISSESRVPYLAQKTLSSKMQISEHEKELTIFVSDEHIPNNTNHLYAQMKDNELSPSGSSQTQSDTKSCSNIQDNEDRSRNMTRMPKLLGHMTSTQTDDFNDCVSTKESIAELLELAGRNFDDNPKLWSRLSTMLQKHQSSFHKRTQALSEERHRSRQLEDDLILAREKLRQYEDNLSQLSHEENCSCMKRSMQHLIETSTTDTLAAAVSAAEAFAVAQDEFKSELQRRDVQIQEQESLITELQRKLGIAEDKLVELEAEKEFALKECELWREKSQEYCNAEERALNELSNYQKSLFEARKISEIEYGEMIAHFKRTIAKQQEIIRSLEQTVKQQRLETIESTKYENLLETKEQMENKLYEHRNEIEKLREAESAYQQHIQERTEILERFHQEEVASLKESLQKSKAAFQQLQSEYKTVMDENRELGDSIQSLKKKVDEQSNIIDDLTRALNETEEDYNKNKLLLRTHQEESLATQNEMALLRKDYRKLQKMLRDQTEKTNTDIQMLQAQLKSKTTEQTRELLRRMEEREKHYRDQIDSMVELRTNERVECIRSKYENKIARLKHYLMRKHSSHRRNSEVRKLVATEIAKMTLTYPALDKVFGSTHCFIGSATAGHWSPDRSEKPVQAQPQMSAGN